ncbi:MAG: hypothetical protein ACYTAO_11375 [Planctomycetota bacterium]
MTKRKSKRTTLPMPGIVGRRYMKGGFKSLGLGCHRTQVDEFNALAKHHGHHGIKYAPNGDCHVSSEQDYAAACAGLRSQVGEPLHPVED